VALPADTSALYLAEMSDTLARAELQQLVVGLVARSSGRLIEAQGGDEPAGEDSRQVQVRVTLDTTHDGLFDLLHGIETGIAAPDRGAGRLAQAAPARLERR
jgi:thymidine phosphorylase